MNNKQPGLTNNLYDVEVIRGQIPSKSNCYISVGGRIVKAEKVRAYERSFAAQCKKYAGKQINRPFTLIAVVYYRNGLYDLDGSFKCLLDCLEYVGAIVNDNLCTRICADKIVDPHDPRVEFSIIPDKPQPSLFGDDFY